MNKIEPVYGLSSSDTSLQSKQTTSAPTMKSSDQMHNIINLGGYIFMSCCWMPPLNISLNVSVEMAKNPLPPCPLKPQLSFHWLVVNGVQPQIAENPSVISAEAEELPHALPKEMQVQHFVSQTYLTRLITYKCLIYL